MKKRILSFLMLTVMLFSLFVITACGDDPASTTPSDTSSTTPQDPGTTPPGTVTLAQAMLNNGYTKIIYPNRDADDASMAQGLNIIKDAFTALTGSTLLDDNDRVKYGTPVPANAKEILFGRTNRASSTTLGRTVEDNRENSAKDYQIVIKDQEINLAVGDSLGYIECAKAFAALLAQPVSLDNYDSGLKQYAWEWATVGGVSLKNYNIVYPQNADTTIQTAAKSLQQALFNVSGYNVTILNDSQAQTANEILIGHTNRQASADLAADTTWRNNNAYDYKFAASGTVIAIMAGDDLVGTKEAVAGFIATQLTADKSATLNWTYDHKKEGLYDLTIAGTPASQFQIVIADKADFDTQYNAIRLQEFLLAHTGYNLNVVTDKAPATAHEILLGTSSRNSQYDINGSNTWKIEYKGGDLYIRGKHYLNVTQALQHFVTMLKTEAADVALLANYTASGSVTDVDLTWTGTTDQTAKDVADDLGVTHKAGTYTLAWNDEFDDFWGDGWLDLEKWHLSDSMGAAKWTDVDFSDDREDGMVTVKDGIMTMYTTYDPTNLATPYSTHHAVVTNNTMNFNYGYLEMRGQPPYRGGVEWPSYWAHSGASNLAKKKYPATSGIEKAPYNDAAYQIEIDFFEIFANDKVATPNLHKWGKFEADPNDPTKTIFSGGPHDQISGKDQGAASSGTREKVFSSTEEANQMHTYGFLWTEHLMAFSVDGEFYYAYDLTANFGGNCEKTMEPFQTQYLQILFNSTVYTEAWLNIYPDPTQPDGIASWISQSIKDRIHNADQFASHFPWEFKVDYVRYYKINNYGELLTTDPATIGTPKDDFQW